MTVSGVWTAQHGLDVGDYYVSKVAIHLVDNKKDAPRLAEREVDLQQFTETEAEAIGGFFQVHLKAIHEAEEGNITRPANFVDGPEMQVHFEKIKEDSSVFFIRSCEMALLLYELSRNTNASPGLLVVILFKAKGRGSTNLALLKMDHKRATRIALKKGASGDVLMELAVHSIDASLPDSGNKVAKWAVIPHPRTSNFDVLYRDELASGDPAKYFRVFVGCDPRPSERIQARSIMQDLPEMVSSLVGHNEVREITRDVVDALLTQPLITREVLTTALSQNISGTETLNNLESILDRAKFKDLSVSSAALEQTTVEYRISGDVVIKGPVGKMRDVLTINERPDGSVQYIITAAQEVDPRYV